MMNKTTIKRKPGVKPNKPIMVVGLPGIGNVGKLVAEHLRRELNAQKFAVLNSPHFPPQVVMMKKGGVKLVDNRFYLIKSKKPKGSDLVILTGDAQAMTPEGQYEVNSRIVKFFKSMNGEFIYTVGGYSIGDAMSQKPRVFGNATGAEAMDRFKGYDVLFGKSRGVIWGSAGLIIAFAKKEKINGVCLMGETTSFLDVDASAAKAVIIQLAKRLDLAINTADLDRIIDKTAQAMRELEKQVGGLGQGQPFGASPPAGEPEHRPSYIR